MRGDPRLLGGSLNRDTASFCGDWSGGILKKRIHTIVGRRRGIMNANPVVRISQS